MPVRFRRLPLLANLHENFTRSADASSLEYPSGMTHTLESGFDMTTAYPTTEPTIGSLGSDPHADHGDPRLWSRGSQSMGSGKENRVSIAGSIRYMSDALAKAVSEIEKLNRSALLLSLNARIEASRAGGQSGQAFSVVAQEMQTLAAQTSEVAHSLEQETLATLRDLREITDRLATETQGTRLSDLALTNIDLIDRNLYERTCDVRWWATDASVVDAVQEPAPAVLKEASRRMGVILNAYTVYFDLIICDLQGTVVANGRPEQFRSVGGNFAQMPWFRAAVESKTGDTFGFQSAHESPLANGRRILVYSCAIRENGLSSGRALGVLAVVFNWDGLAQNIVENVRLTIDERDQSRICIVDACGLILADSNGRQLMESIHFPGQEKLLTSSKDHLLTTVSGKPVIIGHARSQGFETYATGWHSLVIIPRPDSGIRGD